MRMSRGAPWLAAAAVLLVACQSAAGGAPAASGIASSAAGGTAPAAPAPVRELRVGDRAPDFKLVNQDRQDVTLSQFQGRPVQLAFYVWAMSPG